ncbi:MAG: Hint domain-containing protein [Roseovarius sp.]
MATADIDVQAYNGALLSAQLLSGSNTILLGSYGASFTGTLVDDDGTLSTADAGSTFNGAALTYIGSGTATPGAEVLNIFVAAGPPVDVVIFEAGGQMCFHYPAGEPNILGALALNISITDAPYDVFTPLCFCPGTMILTPEGEVAVELLRAGDLVLDEEGQRHEIVWAGRREIVVHDLPAFEPWRPVRLRAGALGPGLPRRDTWLSQQHRIRLGGWKAELFFGEPSLLAPARSLVNGDTILIDRQMARVIYHHIACGSHVTLMANGLPAESLAPAAGGLEGMAEESREELLALFPELLGEALAPFPLAAPLARGYEARLLV